MPCVSKLLRVSIIMMTLKATPEQMRSLWNITEAQNIEATSDPWASQGKCRALSNWQAGSGGVRPSCYLAQKSLHIVCKLIRSDLNCELAWARQLAGCWGIQCLLNLHFLLETCKGEGKLWKSRETAPSSSQNYVQHRHNEASRWSRGQTRIPSSSRADSARPQHSTCSGGTPKPFGKIIRLPHPPPAPSQAG